MFANGIAEGIRGIAAGPMCVLAVRKRFWLATDGFIVGVDLRDIQDPEGRSVRNYMLLFEYGVEGVQYFGLDRIPLDLPYHAEKDALQELCTQFPVGERIAIYYSKSDPAVSSARRDVVGFSKALMMVAIGVIAAYGCYLYIQGVTGGLG